MTAQGSSHHQTGKLPVALECGTSERFRERLKAVYLCIDQNGLRVDVQMNESGILMKEPKRSGKLQDAFLNLAKVHLLA